MADSLAKGSHGPRARSLRTCGPGQVTSLPLLADSVLLAQPDGWYYPNVGIIPGIIALEARAHGYPEQAPALFDKALTWFEARTTDPAATLRARFEHAQVLSWAGRDREAQTQLQRLLDTAQDSARYLGQLGVVAVQLGNHQLAARMDQRLAPLTTPFLYNLHTLWRANIAAAAGRCVRAVDLLRQALLHGQHYSLDLHRMPYYNPIRPCPAFHELAQASGLIVSGPRAEQGTQGLADGRIERMTAGQSRYRTSGRAPVTTPRWHAAR